MKSRPQSPATAVSAVDQGSAPLTTSGLPLLLRTDPSSLLGSALSDVSAARTGVATEADGGSRRGQAGSGAAGRSPLHELNAIVLLFVGGGLLWRRRSPLEDRKKGEMGVN